MGLENGSRLTQSTLKSMSGFVIFLIASSLSPNARATIDNALPLTQERKLQLKATNFEIDGKARCGLKRRQVTNSINKEALFNGRIVSQRLPTVLNYYASRLAIILTILSNIIWKPPIPNQSHVMAGKARAADVAKHSPVRPCIVQWDQGKWRASNQD